MHFTQHIHILLTGKVFKCFDICLAIEKKVHGLKQKTVNGCVHTRSDR